MELQCRVCNGELQPLGALGDVSHFRCRDCGTDHTVKRIAPEEPDRHGERRLRQYMDQRGIEEEGQ